MTLLATLVLAQAPATAADFFPLVPGVRRVYEEKSTGTTTLSDEVGRKTVEFDAQVAIPVVTKNQFNQPMGTTYYRVDGVTVWTVGYAEERKSEPQLKDGSVDYSKPLIRTMALMQLKPAMPVFKYDGKETSWTYSEVPHIEDRDPDKLSTVPGATKAGNVKELDPTSIKGTAKPGKERTVLGRKVETIEVRQEVQLGVGKIAQNIVETSVYGRGIGLIESHRKSTLDGKKQEIRTKLIAIEEGR